MHILDIFIFMISMAIFYTIFICRFEYAEGISILWRRSISFFFAPRNKDFDHTKAHIPAADPKVQKKNFPVSVKAIKESPIKRTLSNKAVYKSAISTKNLSKKS